MKKVNIVYDFDGTLTNTPVPKYLILEKCGYENGTLNEKFLKEVREIKKQKKPDDSVSVFYNRFFEILYENNMKINEKDFYYGVDKIEYNKGIDSYFDNINSFALKNNIELNHFILSSGIKDFIERCKYSKNFKGVLGSTIKKENDIIVGLDYYLTHKGKAHELSLLQENNETKADKTIYVGDGLTDYFAMEYVHNNGGDTIFVHQNENDLDVYNEVNKENIVDYCEIADYTENSKLYRAICKSIIDD